MSNHCQVPCPSPMGGKDGSWGSSTEPSFSLCTTLEKLWRRMSWGGWEWEEGEEWDAGRWVWEGVVRQEPWRRKQRIDGERFAGGLPGIMLYKEVRNMSGEDVWAKMASLGWDLLHQR